MVLRSLASTAFITLILLCIFFDFMAVNGFCDGVVDFHANVIAGDAPLTVQFMDDTSVARSNWNWDFGDGTRDQSKDPVHTYANPGIYTVSLTVMSNGSRIGSEVKPGYVQVFYPAAMATATPEPGVVSIIPGVISTPVPPADASPRPTSNASGITGTTGGGKLNAEDTLQLILAAAIAFVITAIILYLFNNMSKLKKPPEDTSGIKQSVKAKPKPASKPSKPKPAVKEKAPQRLTKKAEDISQDYIYGLVTGNADNKEDSPHIKK